MKPEAQISVCVTTFNSEKYIVNALQSILGQKTNFKYEVIIADDASIDKTVDVVESFFKQASFKNYKLLTSKTNRGVNSNLLAALRICNGKYITLLDADDVWIDENKLQTQFNLLSTNKLLDYSYSNYVYTFEDKNSQQSFGMPPNFEHPKNTPYEEFLVNPYICICTICFKREAINISLIEEFIRRKFISQDYPLLLYISKNFKGHYDPTPTTQIVLKKNSLSRPISLQKKLDYFKNIYEIGTFFIRLYGASQRTKNLRSFRHHLKYLLALWTSLDFIQIKKYSGNLKVKDFIKHQPKSLYILIASKSRTLYTLLRPWVLRKRPPGQ